MSASPPRLARVLTRLACSPEDLQDVRRDLAEHHARVIEARGRGAAWRWYWWQVLRGVAARVRPRRLTAGGGLRVSLRTLIRRPVYALGVSGTLGLGLGSAVAVGTVAWEVWLRPLDIPEPREVVRIYERQPVETASVAGARVGEDGRRAWISPPLLEDLRDQRWGALSAVAGVSRDGRSWARGDEVRRVSALVASPELTEVLGLVPHRGRWFRDGDGLREVVLTADFAERVWGGDPVGAGMELDGVLHSVVGVVDLPDGYPEAADLVMPFAFGESELTEGMRGARYLEVVARLSPGADVATAQAELDAFLAGLAEDHPAHRGWRTEVVGLVTDLFAPYRPAMGLLLAAGIAFLLLAGINVVGLVAAHRAEGRADRAVRRALGATEGRLLAEATGEGIVAGIVGALMGLAGTAAVLPPIRALVPVEVPRLDQVSVGPAAAGSALAAGVLLGAGVGVAAWLVSMGGQGTGLRGRGGSVAGLAARRALVVGQLALTTLLVAGGAAILDHVRTLRGVDMGFDGTGVQVAHVALDARRLTSDEAIRATWDGLLGELRSRGLPAAVGTNAPVSGSTMRFGFRTEPGGEQFFGQYHSVSPDYLDALSIPVLEGRGFSTADDAGGEPVVLVNEALARARFPGESALGRDLEVVGEQRRIVGIVASARHFGPDRPAPEELYVPLAQDPWAVGHVLVPTSRDDAAEGIRAAIRATDPSLDPPPPAPFDAYLAGWYAPLRLQLTVVGVLGGVGLLLAVLGLYAVVAVHVTGRRKEIGIRMALGAPGRSLFGEVLLGGMIMAGVGAILGAAGWLGVRPLLTGILPGSAGGGSEVVVPVALLVVGVSALAALRPAWRSTRVDPGITLQEG